MFSLKNRVAIVTGASSGIGLQTVIALAKAGASVGAAARHLTPLETLSQELTAQGYTVVPLPMDVTVRKDIEASIDAMVKRFGRLDILVNDAGFVEEVPFFDLTDEKWRHMIETNLTGCFRVSQRAAQEMAKNRYGRIINLASVLSGGIGRADMNIAHYTASKGGIIGLTEAMAVELAPLGILVNAVSPGHIDTPMNKEIKENPRLFQEVIDRIPLKRFGKPEEVANLIAFLASEEASYITGSTLYADGGYLSK